jgi:hypothetical protein
MLRVAILRLADAEGMWRHETKILTAQQMHVDSHDADKNLRRFYRDTITVTH